jgi:hypothetical protein
MAYAAGSVAGALAVGLAGESGSPVDDRPFWVTALATVAFWVPLVAMLAIVSDRFATGRFRDDYGLRFRGVDLLGVPIGVLSQLLLLPLLYWPLNAVFEDTFSRDRLEEPAQRLTDRADGAWKIALVLVVVVGAPLVEELVYRGLIHGALAGRLTDGIAVGLSAAFFSLVHLQGVQLVGLFAFGVVLAVSLQWTGRLGMGILAHAAFNATTLIVLWRR